jgi:riboflavin biosynthesis pyrimidine reductase
MTEALRYLRRERGIRSLLCEGGPHLHADLLEAGLVDELFITTGPRLAGGEGPGITSGLPEQVTDVDLAWLLRDGSELFARYRIAS